VVRTFPIKTPPTAGSDALRDAQSALAAGDIATTERLCQTMLTVPAQAGGAWILLTETALLRGRLDAAAVCARNAVTLRPSARFGA
jgi:hypothetical protein